MASSFLSLITTPSRWTTPWRLTVLLVASFVLVVIFELFRLPAALLLGPMITAIILATSGAGMKLPKPMFLMAQGVLGMMIANSLPLTVFAKIAQEWPLFLIGTVSTIVASSFLGWLLSRTGLLPGTTAIWGIVSWCRIGNDHHVGILWRRYATGRLYAVFARGLLRHCCHGRRQRVSCG
ncbi:AbrB family transcriptional regulator [Marinomonas sp. RS-M-Aa-14]|uniref:AbrB family transcriptional regulator n=1 Tax=Marinomonas sp. RS-M-Aa-14 TaxID=3241169 RepID=UPI003AAFC556